MAKIPANIPERPLNDKKREERSMMERIWVRSSKCCFILQITLSYKVIKIIFILQVLEQKNATFLKENRKVAPLNKITH